MSDIPPPPLASLPLPQLDLPPPVLDLPPPVIVVVPAGQETPLSDSSDAPLPPPEAAQDDWVEAKNADGKVYYWNKTKNTTTWERPVGVEIRVPKGKLKANPRAAPGSAATGLLPKSGSQSVPVLNAASKVNPFEKREPASQSVSQSFSTTPEIQKKSGGGSMIMPGKLSTGLNLAMKLPGAAATLPRNMNSPTMERKSPTLPRSVSVESNLAEDSPKEAKPKAVRVPPPIPGKAAAPAPSPTPTPAPTPAQEDLGVTLNPKTSLKTSRHSRNSEDEAQSEKPLVKSRSSKTSETADKPLAKSKSRTEDSKTSKRASNKTTKADETKPVTPQQAAQEREKKLNKKDVKANQKKEKKLEKERQKSRKKLAFDPMFGQTLDKLIALQKQNGVQSELPIPLVLCINYLNFEAVLASQGIFRQSGRLMVIQELKAALDDWLIPELHLVSDYHTVSGLFKLFLRELPEPLLPFTAYDRLVELARGGCRAPESLPAIRGVLISLPKINLNCLALLLELLSNTAAYTKENLMNEDNLAIVIAPNVMRPKTETMSSVMGDTPLVHSVFSTMIGHYRELFSGLDVPSCDSVSIDLPDSLPLVQIHDDAILDPAEKEKIKANLGKWYKKRPEKQQLVKKGVLKEAK